MLLWNAEAKKIWNNKVLHKSCWKLNITCTVEVELFIINEFINLTVIFGCNIFSLRKNNNNRLENKNKNKTGWYNKLVPLQSLITSTIPKFRKQILFPHIVIFFNQEIEISWVYAYSADLLSWKIQQYCQWAISFGLFCVCLYFYHRPSHLPLVSGRMFLSLVG